MIWSSVYKMISNRTFKKMIGFVACLLVSTAFACAPLNPTQNDTNSSNSVTMTLEVSPITRWTFHATNRPGQPTTSAKAVTYAKNDVDQAIKLILAENKMDPNALTVETKYTAQQCQLFDVCPAAANAVPNSCIGTDVGTVPDECNADGSSTPLVKEITVKLTAKIPVPTSDWQRLAYKLREKLEVKNVMFEKDISLTQ
ncbi:unnamed protein product [Auanema sp. JU1783]|nr:unnamed protein product [Auanema sp. JU1783]